MTSGDPYVAHTPYGVNQRHRIRFHVVGVDGRPDGSFLGADRHHDMSVITPLGAWRAVAVATMDLMSSHPDWRFREVELVDIDDNLTRSPGDIRDSESYGR